MTRLKVPSVLVAVGFLLGLIAWTYFTSPTSGAGTVSASSVTVPGGAAGRRATTPSKHSKSTTTTAKPAPTTTVAPNPQAYATALYNDWAHRDRASAQRLAESAAVDALFHRSWRPSNAWVAQGCQSAAGSTACTWARPHWHLVILVRNPAGRVPVRVMSVRFSH